MNTSLDYESSLYHSGNAQAIRLLKPIPHEEMRRIFPNLKGICIEFGRSEFKPLKINHDEYLEKLLDLYDLEELIIESGNRLTKIPDNLWKSPLKLLSINQIGSKQNIPLELKSTNAYQLESLSIDFQYIIPSDDLLELPTLKEINFTNCSNIGLLNKATNLRQISLTASGPHLGLDFQCFPNLKGINIRPANYKENIEDLFDFSNNKHLQDVFLNNFIYFPIGLGSSLYLRNVYLSNLGNAERLEIITFEKMHNLTSISLENCHVNYNEEVFLGEMPSINSIRIIPPAGYTPQLNAKIFTSKYLIGVNISCCKLPLGLKRKINKLHIQSHLFNDNIIGLKPYEYISCYDLDNTCLKHEDWKNLTNLKNISITRAKALTELPSFDEKNVALESITIDELPTLKLLPNSWANIPTLTSVTIRNCDELEVNNWTAFKSLKSLYIQGKVKIIPNEILLWSNLSKIEIDKRNVSDSNFAYLEDITKITLDDTLCNETKLMIGCILFENSANITQIPNYKAVFLSIFNAKSFRFKQMAWENLHLINDPFTLSLELLAQKSIVLLGKTKNNKTYYKEKLISLGSTYKSKVDAQTEIIVVGENFELPEEFWQFPHIFITEAALENLLKDFQPGFIQTLESNEIHNLRMLLWSNEVENEKIVVEMIKSGGIADAIIPDLVVIAKTSKDNSVKTVLKKLLKAKLSAGGQKILSDKINLKSPPSYRNPYEVYSLYEPDFDIAQMALTNLKRGGGSAHDFFKIKGSEQNLYRQELFNEIYSKFLEKPHYVDARWEFTSDEMNFILSQPILKGQLKRLYIGNYDLENILPSLLIHKDTLEDFEFSTLTTTLPQEISHFQKIKKLAISADNLESLPISIIEMKKLKELFIYTEKKVMLDITLKPLEDLPRFYCSAGWCFDN